MFMVDKCDKIQKPDCKEGGRGMLDRNSTIICPEKGKEFTEFLHKNAKNEDYWKEVQRKASTPLDKREIDALFEKENKK